MARSTLHLDDGRRIDLGSDEHVRAANRQIADATGGSSGAGRWSRVFGLMPGENTLPADELDQLKNEAADLLGLINTDLGEDAQTLLKRLAAL